MNGAIAATLAALLIASPVWAEDADSANYVMPGCRNYIGDQPTNAMGAYCLGIVYGLTYGLNNMSPESYFCIPQGVRGAQGVRVVVAYIDARPARMHEDFAKLAFEALINAWPCPKTR